jgi:hypothetical protein
MAQETLDASREMDVVQGRRFSAPLKKMKIVFGNHLSYTIHLMNPKVLYALPQDILTKIYSYDNTYFHKMKRCIAHIRLCGARKIRLQKEIRRLQEEADVEVLSLPDAIRNVSILFHGKEFRMKVPVDYPFEPPVVYYENKKFRTFDTWSPAASLLTVLLTCEVEENDGCEMC